MPSASPPQWPRIRGNWTKYKIFINNHKFYFSSVVIERSHERVESHTIAFSTSHFKCGNAVNTSWNSSCQSQIWRMQKTHGNCRSLLYQRRAVHLYCVLYRNMFSPSKAGIKVRKERVEKNAKWGRWHLKFRMSLTSEVCQCSPVLTHIRSNQSG